MKITTNNDRCVSENKVKSIGLKLVIARLRLLDVLQQNLIKFIHQHNNTTNVIENLIVESAKGDQDPAVNETNPIGSILVKIKFSTRVCRSETNLW